MNLIELFQTLAKSPATVVVACLAFAALLVAWKALDVALHALNKKDKP